MYSVARWYSIWFLGHEMVQKVKAGLVARGQHLLPRSRASCLASTPHALNSPPIYHSLEITRLDQNTALPHYYNSFYIYTEKDK